MKKYQTLLSTLTTEIPELAAEPNKINVFIKKGKVIATGRPGLSFEYRYRLMITLSRWAGDPDQLMTVVLEWLQENQPNELNNSQLRGKLFRFKTSLMQEGNYDITLKLNLTESVPSRDSEQKLSRMTDSSYPYWTDHRD